MARVATLRPKLSAPVVVARGTVSKPSAPPNARFQAPLLATPAVITPEKLPHQKGPSGAGKSGKKS